MAGGVQHEFKVVLVGDGSTGKTTFVRRHQSGEFERKYIPTVGVTVEAIPWYTTAVGHSGSGEVWVYVDVMYDDEAYLSDLREGYYIGSHAGIIMFDVTTRITYRNVPNWHRDILRVCGDIPIVLLGNKVDMKEREVLPRTITYHRKKNLKYFELSVKSNYNYEKPFIYLLRKLLRDDNLSLVKQPALPPAEVEIDRQSQAQNEDAIAAIDSAEFPEDAF